MSYYKSLGYAAFLHCDFCSRGEPIKAEQAWWDGEDLHLLHDDGTKVVIKDAAQKGYRVEGDENERIHRGEIDQEVESFAGSTE